VKHKSRKLGKVSFVLLFITVVLFSFSINTCATNNIEDSNLIPPLDVLWEYKDKGRVCDFDASDNFIYINCFNPKNP